MRRTKAPAALAAPTGPWIDRPDALELLKASNAPPVMKEAARELITDGFTILRRAISPDQCRSVIEDYGRFTQENAETVAEALDEHGRERRLIQFHEWSEASMEIATDPGIMSILDYLFGRRACAYTSLTFKYGTQQRIHRDVPHFATWPDSQFVGVWTALEDIHEDAGPLWYVKGGHRFAIDHQHILRLVRREHPHLTEAEQILSALHHYDDAVDLQSRDHGELVIAPAMKRGDVAIWHAQLPHGGSPAKDPTRSRWSMVVHCTPEAIQSHQFERFFTHESQEPPIDRYGFHEAHGRKVAYNGDVAFG